MKASDLPGIVRPGSLLISLPFTPGMKVSGIVPQNPAKSSGFWESETCIIFSFINYNFIVPVQLMVIEIHASCEVQFLSMQCSGPLDFKEAF